MTATFGGAAVSEVGQQAVAAVLGANPFVRLDPTEAATATSHMLGRLFFTRRLPVEQRQRLMAELRGIFMGESDLAPDRRDRRFVDPAWTDNPMYRRWMQGYLLAANFLKELPDQVGMVGREADRARFLTTMVADAIAPTNLLAGNPAAVKRAFETGGRSLVTGFRHFLGDLGSNGGMPSQVDLTPFRLGDNLAIAPGAVVYRSDVLELIQYAPTTTKVHRRPIVMVPPQINKFYVLDLAAGRSMVQHAVASGQQVFMVSWRNPSPGDAAWDLAKYVTETEAALEVAKRITRADRVNLLGACAGGVTTTTLLAHLAGEGRRLVESVTFLVTVIDTEAETAVTMFATDRAVASAIRHSRRRGVLEGRKLARAFAWLRPNDLVWNYWVNNYLMGEPPPAFDVLAWNADSTNLPAGLHADFLSLFAANALAHPGTMKLNGVPIDPTQIDVDSYVLGALTDHITPWKACYRTPFLLGGKSEFVLSSSGHIQALVNPPDNPKASYYTNTGLPVNPEEWLAGAESRQGSWWDHWLRWLTERSGDERKAPAKVGSAAYPPIEPAPGSYVRA